MALGTFLLALRRSPVLLKLPPYLSALCVVVGLAWLLILPLDEYSRQTYISENAILPGQVNNYFGGSEHNVFRAFRQEVFALSQRSDQDRIDGLHRAMRDVGLKTASQTYEWHVAGDKIRGTNVYGVLRGPRADATEAMVLVAAWRNFNGELNYSGVALALSLMRYFRRWSVWSKDIILLVPEDSTYGPEAWVAAYHSPSSVATSTRNVSALPLKAGALQGAVALDYPAGPWGHRFDRLDVVYDGINGALPNLDLLNTAVSVASSQQGIGCTLHGLTNHGDSYSDRLTTIAKGVLTQSLGHATGPHSAFMPYHVDAVTLRTVGDGWHDEMSLGRVTESLMRSINNLLEHLHQSFFFYILLNTNRFVSIGNYLPAAMIIAGNFTITALALWVRSGQAPQLLDRKPGSSGPQPKMEVVKDGQDMAIVPTALLRPAERKMFLPALLILAIHLVGLLIFYLLNNLPKQLLPSALHTITLFTILLPPVLLSPTLAHSASLQQLHLLQSFSLLFLGAALSMLAALNFSLAFVIGTLAAPLSFIRPLPSVILSTKSPGMASRWRSLSVAVPAVVLLFTLAPPVLLYALPYLLDRTFAALLTEIARAWVAQGVWTALVVWALWWPAWVVGASVLWAGLFAE